MQLQTAAVTWRIDYYYHTIISTTTTPAITTSVVFTTSIDTTKVNPGPGE